MIESILIGVLVVAAVVAVAGAVFILILANAMGRG